MSSNTEPTLRHHLSNDPTVMVFEAIPANVKDMECSSPLLETDPKAATTQSANHCHETTTKKKKKNADDAGLYLVLVVATILMVCFNFIAFSYFLRPRQFSTHNHHTLRVVEETSGQAQERIQRQREWLEMVQQQQQFQPIGGVVIEEDRDVFYSRYNNRNADVKMGLQSATELTEDTFDKFLDEHPMAFINFYIPRHDAGLMLSYPNWQGLARKMQESQLPVGVGQVNCHAQASICRKQNIYRCPTMRWFEKPTDYLKSQTSEDDLVAFAKGKAEQMNGKLQVWGKKAGIDPFPEGWFVSKVGQPVPDWERQLFNGRDGQDMLRMFRPHYHRYDDKEQTIDYRFDLRPVETDSQVMDLTPDTYDQFLQDHDMVFVNFCKSNACQTLASPWEQFAQIAHDLHMPIGVGRMNCTAHHEFCRQTFGITVAPRVGWICRGVNQGYVSVGGSVGEILDFAMKQLDLDRISKPYVHRTFHKVGVATEGKYSGFIDSDPTGKIEKTT
jgi:hypothetical protein